MTVENKESSNSVLNSEFKAQKRLQGKDLCSIQRMTESAEIDPGRKKSQETD